MIDIHWLLFLSLALFAVGVFGVIARRNLLFILLSLEIMLNAVVLLFVAASSFHGNPDGQIMYVLVLTLAAAEVAIGLGLVIHMYRQHHHLDVDKLTQLGS